MIEKRVINFLVLCTTFKVSTCRIARDDTSSFNSSKTVQDLRNPWIDPASIRSKSGREDFIQCSVTSNAPVAFEWRKDGQVINDSITTMSLNPEIGTIRITDIGPMSRDKGRLNIYKSVLRFMPLTVNSNGSYSCLIHGPGYEKTETVSCLVFVSNSFDGYHHELTSERKFLAGAVILIFSILFLGTILVTFFSFKL